VKGPRQEGKHDGSSLSLRSSQRKATVAKPIAYDEDILLADGATAITNFVAQFARLENDNLEMIRAMNRNVPPPVQDQEANVNRICTTERPDVLTFSIDLLVDVGLGSLPRLVRFCSHGGARESRLYP
jgi:hypothetical protein